MTAVLTVAAPVFAVIAAGALAGAFGVLKAGDVPALNRFVFNAAMPAALFSLTANAPDLGDEALELAGAYALAVSAVIAVAYGACRRLLRRDPEDAGALALAAGLGNAVFLGLPIALGVPGWGPPFVVLMLVEGTLVISLGAALIAPRADGGALAGLRAGVGRALRNPLVLAMIVGLVVSRLGVAPPAPAQTFVDILGRAAGPAALFSLGLFFATRPAPSFDATLSRAVAVVGLCKMALLPGLTLSLAGAFGVVDPAYVGAAALFTLVPSAVGAFVMADAFGRAVADVAAIVAVTSALSLATVSAVLVVFAG
ncbi:MAG: AEC family transporter [Pseudomonadota bacterium]